MTTGTAEAQLAQGEAPALLPLDEEFTEVEIRQGERITLYHRLRRPTLDELRRRERAQTIWQEDAGHGETETIIETAEANRALWDSIIVATMNYDSPGWRPIDDEFKRAMPAVHKEKAVEALYAEDTEFVAASYLDEDAGIYRLSGPAELHVKQTVKQAFPVSHFLRQPSESEWNKYTKRAYKLIEERRAGKRTRARVQTDMGVAVAFYDALIIRMEGVTLAGEPWTDARRAEFIGAYDPLLKTVVASCLRTALTPSIQDL